MKTLSRLLLASSLIFGACQTPHEFVDDRSGKWTIQTGQLKYTSGARVLVGEVVVNQMGASGFQIEFLKGGGLPLLKLRMDATTARAEGIFARGSWQGPPDCAPKPLRGWIGLREALAKRQAERFTVTPPNSEDRFDFVFNH